MPHQRRASLAAAPDAQPGARRARHPLGQGLHPGLEEDLHVEHPREAFEVAQARETALVRRPLDGLEPLAIGCARHRAALPCGEGGAARRPRRGTSHARQELVAAREERQHHGPRSALREQGLPLRAERCVDRGAEVLVVTQIGEGAGHLRRTPRSDALVGVALPAHGAAWGGEVGLGHREPPREAIEQRLHAREHHRRHHPPGNVALRLRQLVQQKEQEALEARAD